MVLGSGLTVLGKTISLVLKVPSRPPDRRTAVLSGKLVLDDLCWRTLIKRNCSSCREALEATAVFIPSNVSLDSLPHLASVRIVSELCTVLHI